MRYSKDYLTLIDGRIENAERSKKGAYKPSPHPFSPSQRCSSCQPIPYCPRQNYINARVWSDTSIRRTLQ